GHWNTEGLFDANRQIMSFAKAVGVYTGVDIGWSAYLGWNEYTRETVFDFLPFTDFLFVNEEELKELSGKEKGGEIVLLEKGCKNVIIHKGKRGSAWISEDFEISCDAFDVKPIKPTGAGDVFNAGFIYAFLKGKEPKECLRFANACAATHIQTAKNAYPGIKEVEYLLYRKG
ncbi:MAG: carbohydrate kinase family protein, partial [Candidatus Methanospirareceae archaeon]